MKVNKKHGAHVMCLGGSLNSPPRPEPAYAECSPETAGGERETEQSTEDPEQMHRYHLWHELSGIQLRIIQV